MDWLAFINNFGFPIALVVYLMYERRQDRQSLEREKAELNQRMSDLEKYVRTRFDTILTESTTAITESTAAIRRLEEWLDRSHPSGDTSPNGTQQ